MGKTMNFAGLDDWFEVFRTGTHTDSAGHTSKWTEAELDAIIAATTLSEHEPPLVVGHPTLNAPAYGWLNGVKREGGRLLAKGKDIMSEFDDMVQQGRFRKRSIALYPDMSIKHIGFLGAVPPAVKGLKDVAFAADDESLTIEFGESTWAFESIARIFRRLRDYLIEEKGADEADKIIRDWDIEDIKEAANVPEEAAVAAYTEGEDKKNQEVSMNIKDLLKKKVDELPDDLKVDTIPPGGQFSEADLNAAKEAGKKEATASFAEQAKKDRAALAKTAIAEFCEARKKEGKLLPAWQKLGLQEFMESLDIETTFEFAEAGTKSSQLDFMKAFLSEIDKVVEFGEIAKRGDDTGAGAGTAGDKLTILTKKHMSDNKELSFAAAFAQVQQDNPDLAHEYEIEFKGGE